MAMRYAGLGMELAGMVTVCTLIGVWVDRQFGTRMGVIVGATTGIVGGLASLIRRAYEMQRKFDSAAGFKQDRDASDDRDHGT